MNLPFHQVCHLSPWQVVNHQNPQVAQDPEVVHQDVALTLAESTAVLAHVRQAARVLVREVIAVDPVLTTVDLDLVPDRITQEAALVQGVILVKDELVSVGEDIEVVLMTEEHIINQGSKILELTILGDEEIITIEILDMIDMIEEAEAGEGLITITIIAVREG